MSRWWEEIYEGKDATAESAKAVNNLTALIQKTFEDKGTQCSETDCCHFSVHKGRCLYCTLDA